MTLDEYRKAWQEQEVPDRGAPDEEELLAWVQEKSEAFERKIRRRDLLETLAAVVVAGCFAYEAATSATWMARVGAAIVVLSSGFIAWWLRRARKAGPTRAADRSVADRLRAERERVEIQIRLLRSVLWWYLGPLAVGVVLFVLGLPSGPVATVVTLTIVASLCGVIWWLNRREVRRYLRPRRDELTRLLDELEGT